MFLRNCWYVAGWSHDLPPAAPMAMEILGDPIVLYRKTNGEAVALENRCLHRLAPLSLGRCEGDRIRCMYHGLLYEADGRLIEIPGQDMLPLRSKLRSYPVIERDSWIWVWMGEEGQANPELIPQSVSLDHPDWVMGHGHLDYEADYRLLNDNLTDFSHLSWVHANSFRSGANWSLSRPDITPLDRGIHVSRWVHEDPVPPYLTDRASGSVDQWVHYDYLAPGVLLLSTNIHRAGAANRANGGEPDEEPLFATFSAQAVTPMNSRSTRYFFSWGPRSQDGTRTDADAMMKVALMAFGEDKVMIEAQQKIIDKSPQRRVTPIAADQGVAIFTRVLDRLIAAEAQ